MTMPIISQPYRLGVKNDDISCPCCHTQLEKEVKLGTYRSECGYCRYGDRPFGMCGKSREYQYPNGCYCEFEQRELMYITCKKCHEPRCIKCQKQFNCSVDNCSSQLCNNCLDKQRFDEMWKTSTPVDKLEVYGILKLRILAKQKNIKGLSRLKKDELISVLSPLVKESDFPIK